MTEVEELRAEVAKLREEVERLRADRSVHHYHHQAAPMPLTLPTVSPTVAPHWPGYFPATCGGTARGQGMAIAGGTDVRCENGPRSL